MKNKRVPLIWGRQSFSSHYVRSMPVLLDSLRSERPLPSASTCFMFAKSCEKPSRRAFTVRLSLCLSANQPSASEGYLQTGAGGASGPWPAHASGSTTCISTQSIKGEHHRRVGKFTPRADREYMCMHVCMHAHTHIYKHNHTHTHTHTHAHTHLAPVIIANLSSSRHRPRKALPGPLIAPR